MRSIAGAGLEARPQSSRRACIAAGRLDLLASTRPRQARASCARTAQIADNDAAPAGYPPVNIADLRREYHRDALDRERTSIPIRYGSSSAGSRKRSAPQLPEPTAMTLATVGPDGRPGARIVLLKGVDARGLVFFTNYDSRKGARAARAARRRAAVSLGRARAPGARRGRGRQVADAESDAYFASRPLGVAARCVGVAAKPSRFRTGEWLEARVRCSTRTLRGRAMSVPRPPHWGGYPRCPDARSNSGRDASRGCTIAFAIARRPALADRTARAVSVRQGARRADSAGADRAGDRQPHGR